VALYQRATRKVQISEIVNSGTGKQPDGAALPSEGELSRLRNGGRVKCRMRGSDNTT
jgi:hypothetical protein